MGDNKFRNCANQIADSDLNSVEDTLSYKLPKDFRDHCLKYNGGNPERNIFDQSGSLSPMEVVGFYPIKFNTLAFDSQHSLLLEHYTWMHHQAVIPIDLLPFAHDPGGNFFCLDLEKGGVVFYATDSFSQELTRHENHIKLKTFLTDSFGDFMTRLRYNENVDCDEWPDD